MNAQAFVFSPLAPPSFEALLFLILVRKREGGSMLSAMGVGMPIGACGIGATQEAPDIMYIQKDLNAPRGCFTRGR